MAVQAPLKMFFLGLNRRLLNLLRLPVTDLQARCLTDWWMTYLQAQVGSQTGWSKAPETLTLWIASPQRQPAWFWQLC